jgi:hypothetical protein
MYKEIYGIFTCMMSELRTNDLLSCKLFHPAQKNFLLEQSPSRINKNLTHDCL